MTSSPEIQLRPWLARDVAALVEASREADVARQLGGELDTGGAAAWIEQRRPTVGSARTSCTVAVDGRAVGEVALVVEARHRTGWLSYWIAPPVRGRALASRAAATLAAWGFEERSLARIELGCRANNPASIRVAQRAGFQREGVQRSKLEYDGERFDVVTFARLAADPAPDLELLVLGPIGDPD